MGHKETIAAIVEFVNRRRAFVDVCIGPALSDKVKLDDKTAAFPLKPVGNYANVSYGTELIRELGVPINRSFLETSVKQGRPFNNIVVLVHCELADDEFELAKAGRSTHVSRVRALLAFFSAGELVPIVRFAWHQPNFVEAEFLAPRALNGVPQRHQDDPLSIEFLREVHASVEGDDLFHFFLGQLHGAQGEPDSLFRIARLFSVLEALAGPITRALKKKDPKIGSRTGVRVLLGYYVDFDVPRFELEEIGSVEFDHVELAGQARDRLFHGAGPLKLDEASAALRPGVELLQKHPNMIAHALRRDCERELVAYAKRTGRAWRARQGEIFESPEKLSGEQLGALAKLHVASKTPPNGNIGSVYVRISGPSAALVRLGIKV